MTFWGSKYQVPKIQFEASLEPNEFFPKILMASLYSSLVGQFGLAEIICCIFSYRNRWQIQNFPDGAPTPDFGAKNLLFRKVSVENCMKKKRNWTGGACPWKLKS